MIIATAKTGTAKVAPYTGAWIEIVIYLSSNNSGFVAPYTGAWIEIEMMTRDFLSLSSHPTRVRGLKCKIAN